MKVLTDTHTLIWALSNPELLSSKARQVLTESEVIASVVNLWELVLKMHKPGALLADPVKWWTKYISGNSIPALSVRSVHIEALSSLAELHKDPFDRILVAQAIVEELPLVTKDANLGRYGISVIW